MAGSLLEWLAMLGATPPASPRAETPAPAVSPPDEAIPFYPTEKYLARNWAPDTGLLHAHIRDIAAASRLAEERGVLTPELAQHMLPIAMVENRGRGMGVFQGEKNALYASQRVRKKISDMGLDLDKDFVSYWKKGDRMLMPGDLSDELLPRFSAIWLSEKARNAKSLEEATKLYNGKGRALEDLGHGEVQQADTGVYWGKIQEAVKMLKHPANEGLASAWNRYRKP